MPARRQLLLVVITLVILCLPVIVHNTYLLSIFIVIGLYAVIAEGLGILVGYAGQVSFGQAAFYGLGAYTAGILATRYNCPPLLCIFIAPLLPTLIALLIGRSILKLREHYLALATLGFGILTFAFFNELTGLTGGPSGLTGIPYLSIGSFVLDTDREYFYLVWLVLGLTLLGAANLTRSPVGRAFKAIHSSELAAEASGINCASLKLQAFGLSAFLAGLAGSLYAFWVTFLGPSPFGFTASIEFVLMVVVGGLGTLWGPVLGAAIIVGLTEFLRWAVPVILPAAGGEFEIVFFGIIFVLILLLRPQGIILPALNQEDPGKKMRDQQCSA